MQWVHVCRCRRMAPPADRKLSAKSRVLYSLETFKKKMGVLSEMGVRGRTGRSDPSDSLVTEAKPVAHWVVTT